MASDSEASCVSDPNFAVICSFLENFGESCGITSPDFLELQEMLENSQELSQALIDIHLKLLRKINKSVSADRWERVLIKLCHTYCSQDAWELERFGYKKARLSSKLRILKQLLEMQFDFNQKFKAEVNRLTASELRKEPIGRDKHGHSYWYQVDEHCQLRVYREDPDEETWMLVAKDREGLMRLISQLASDDPNLADLPLNEDSNSLEIEKPILDTGQTSSSTSNCEAEVDESSGGNEDSKDVPSEAQTESSPLETSPVETSATETSVTENTTPVDEKLKTEKQPTISKLKFKISTSEIIPQKQEEQPENLSPTIVKKEETKLQEKSKQSVGIDLSIPQTSIQPQAKGVDLTKRKKSINDLAVNLRMKTHDMLYKNPVQEQEIDLSIKKPRMDPQQFSSLSVPPFEPISIENALKMSSNLAESDEDEETEDEEDDFYDEDEIELPSHMKQPRLDRPTLLSKTKKRTYSDEEDEYGEEIEEPVMLIRGEGSGKDCENENVHKESEDYSEAVEEPVIFFYGEGSGFDCDTGNTGKEQETSSSNKNTNDSKDSACSENVKSKSLDLILTKEKDDGLKIVKDTESASSSSGKVQEIKDKQKAEQSVEETVAHFDCIDVKSDLVLNENKEKEQSQKCYKIGTIMVDVKSVNRSQTSDVCSKKNSRWDIGKPVKSDRLESSKIVDYSTIKEICDDSTNSSIKNNENSDVKLLNISKDKTDNTISDNSVTNVKTAVNKSSELQILDKAEQDSENKETMLDNKDDSTVEPLTDTQEALSDQETEEIKKQPMFFFGPRCFQFKTPTAPPDVKESDINSSDLMLKSNEQEKFDPENKTFTKKASSETDTVPTCIKKADILIDNKEQITLSIHNTKIDDIADTSKENAHKDYKDKLVESKKQINLSELNKEISLSKTEVKNTTIDNKDMLPTEESVELLRKPNNKSLIVELNPGAKIKSFKKETLKVDNLEKLSCETSPNKETIDLAAIESSTGKTEVSIKETKDEKKSEALCTKDKIIQRELCIEENQETNFSLKSLESSIESLASKSDLYKVKEDELGKIKKSETITIESTVDNQKEKEQFDIEITNTAKENMSVAVQQNKLKIGLSTSESEAHHSSAIISKDLSNETDLIESCKNISHNIVHKTCSNDPKNTILIATETILSNIVTTKNNLTDTKTSTELPSSAKDNAEITDDNSETLSETLDSLSTLLDTKSDESDDQLKKSAAINIVKDFKNDTLQKEEKNENPVNVKLSKNDTLVREKESLESTEEILLTSEDQMSDLPDDNENNSSQENKTLKPEEKFSDVFEDQESDLTESNIFPTTKENEASNYKEKKPSTSEDLISDSTDNNVMSSSTDNIILKSEEEISVSFEKQISESADNNTINSSVNNDILQKDNTAVCEDQVHDLKDSNINNSSTENKTFNPKIGDSITSEELISNSTTTNTSRVNEVLNPKDEILAANKSSNKYDNPVTSKNLISDSTTTNTSKRNKTLNPKEEISVTSEDHISESVGNISFQENKTLKPQAENSVICDNQISDLTDNKKINPSRKNETLNPEEKNPITFEDKNSNASEDNVTTPIPEEKMLTTSDDQISDSVNSNITSNEALKSAEEILLISKDKIVDSPDININYSSKENETLKLEEILVTSENEAIKLEKVIPVKSEDPISESADGNIMNLSRENVALVLVKDISLASEDQISETADNDLIHSDRENEKALPGKEISEAADNDLIHSDRENEKALPGKDQTSDSIDNSNITMKEGAIVTPEEEIMVISKDQILESVDKKVSSSRKNDLITPEEKKSLTSGDKISKPTDDKETVPLIKESFKCKISKSGGDNEIIHGQQISVLKHGENIESDQNIEITIENTVKTGFVSTEENISDAITQENKEEKTKDDNLKTDISDVSVSIIDKDIKEKNKPNTTEHTPVDIPASSNITEVSKPVFLADDNVSRIYKKDEVKDPKIENKSGAEINSNIVNEPSTNINKEQKTNDIKIDESVTSKNDLSELSQIKDNENNPKTVVEKLITNKIQEGHLTIVKVNPAEKSDICSLKNKTKIFVKNKTSTSNKTITENEKNEEITKTSILSTEENTETDVSNKEKRKENEPIIDNKKLVKENKIENILPYKAEPSINLDVKSPASDLNLEIKTVNTKPNISVINKSLNKSIESVPKQNLENKKYIALDTALELKKLPVEVNHITNKNDIPKMTGKLEKKSLEEAKKIKPPSREDKSVNVKNDGKAHLSEKVADSGLKSSKTVDKKNKEPMAIKLIEITTLQRKVAKEGNDDINIDNSTHQIIAQKNKSSKEIIISSNQNEIKDSKEKSTNDSVFDNIKEINKESTITESIQNVKVKIKKGTKDSGLSDENKDDTSDDDVMDSCAFENDNNDSDGEEKSTIHEKEKLPKILKHGEKLNHSEKKVQATGSKIVLKDINELIDKSKFFGDKCLPSKPEIKVIKVGGNDFVKEKFDNISETDIKINKLIKSGAVDFVKIERKDRKVENISNVKLKKSALVQKIPTLTCIDITKLQEKSMRKPENKPIIKLKQQLDITLPRSLESIGVINEESNDIIDIPETDPLACTEEEILISKKIEKESSIKKPKRLSLTTFKLDDTEETNTSALIPEPIARALRSRKVSMEVASTFKRSSDGAVDGSGSKKRRGRGRPRNMGNRPQVEKKNISSSEEENDKPLEIRSAISQTVTGKASKGRDSSEEENDVPLNIRATISQRGTGKARRGRGNIENNKPLEIRAPIPQRGTGKARRGRGNYEVEKDKPLEIRPTLPQKETGKASKDRDSSEEDSDKPLEIKATIPQRGTGKARRGRGRGRGRGGAHIERGINDSPVLGIDPQSETSLTEVTVSPHEHKTPSKKKKKLLGLDIDPAAIIQHEAKEKNEELITRSTVRQSRRIAQIKIKEQAEHRKIDDLTHMDIREEHKKKKKRSNDDKDFKAEKKKKKHKVITEDEEESEEEIVEVSGKIKHKKKRKQDLRKLFNMSNPWQSSSGSSTSHEEEEEEVEEEPTDEEAPALRSDHEFSPESDLESSAEVQPLRRARTVKKESDTEEPTDEHACQKCGKADHPEWILLCDKCDCGWHCSCLRPALLVIPEGDWFCPPCQHFSLVKVLKVKVAEFDKKMNRREMEERRKERLAYVGISLDNVLPTKDQEGIKEHEANDQNQEMGSRESSSDSDSDSESGSSSGDESEPIYQLRERRQAQTYRFNDYDDLINSAIQDEIEAVKGAGNQGRGKDIATIVNAEKEEAKTQAFLEQQTLQDSAIERPPPVVPVYAEKPERDAEASEGSSDGELRVVPKLVGRKKHRKLNSLDISSEDDAADDEDFKGTSASEEEDVDELGSEDSDDLEGGRRGKGRSGPTRRSTRARVTRYDREFIDDNSEDDLPKRKKSRSIWDESESEESDKSWGKRKKSIKKQRHFSTPRSSKKSRKRKRRNIDDSDPEVKRRTKKPKIKYGGLNDSDDEEFLTRKTRGKKINYIDALGSDTDEDIKIKTKPLQSEDEYVANEDDEDAEEAMVIDEVKESESDSTEIPPVVPRKIIKIIAPSKVAKGRGKAGIPRPEHLKPVTPPPPPVVPEPKLMEEMAEDIEEEEEEESEPQEPVDIPVIAANPDDLNEDEVGTMMMENEEYAKKQLALMAIQLAREKKKKEKEAKKLAEKKEILVSPEAAIPAEPKKRGRKKKSEIEAKLAATKELLTVPPIIVNPTFIQPPIQNPDMPLNQPELVEKLSLENPNIINIPPNEIPDTVPTVVSDLSNSPPKRRGRGKGKKTLAAQASVTPSSDSSSQPLPETVTAHTIVPPSSTAVLTSTAAISPSLNTMPNLNIPTSAQNDPPNLSPNANVHGGKLGIAAPPQPFSQNQPTPSVITRMLQSQPISAQTFTASASALSQKYFPPGISSEQQAPRGSPSSQFPPIAGRGRVPSPYRQSSPAIGLYPGVRPMAPNSPHRLRSPGPPSMQMFHSTHHSMDPSPSGGGTINIAPSSRDRSSPGNVSPMTSKEGPTPPPPPYSRAVTAVNRFSPNENSPGPSLPPPIRHHLFPQAAAHLQQSSPPPRPPPPGNFSPYHPPPPPTYHYGAYPPAPSLAAADDALPPTDYQGSPYPEQYNSAEGTVHSSEGSNSKPFDEEGSGEFGGLVSYFSSQREDDLDT